MLEAELIYRVTALIHTRHQIGQFRLIHWSATPMSWVGINRLDPCISLVHFGDAIASQDHLVSVVRNHARSRSLSGSAKTDAVCLALSIDLLLLSRTIENMIKIIYYPDDGSN